MGKIKNIRVKFAVLFNLITDYLTSKWHGYHMETYILRAEIFRNSYDLLARACKTSSIDFSQTVLTLRNRRRALLSLCGSNCFGAIHYIEVCCCVWSFAMIFLSTLAKHISNERVCSRFTTGGGNTFRNCFKLSAQKRKSVTRAFYGIESDGYQHARPYHVHGNKAQQRPTSA